MQDRITARWTNDDRPDDEFDRLLQLLFGEDPNSETGTRQRPQAEGRALDTGQWTEQLYRAELRVSQ